MFVAEFDNLCPAICCLVVHLKGTLSGVSQRRITLGESSVIGYYLNKLEDCSAMIAWR